MDDGRGGKSYNEGGLAGQPGKEGELELGPGLASTELESTAHTASEGRERDQDLPHTLHTFHTGQTHGRLVIVLTVIEILDYSFESQEFLLWNSI